MAEISSSYSLAAISLILVNSLILGPITPFSGFIFFNFANRLDRGESIIGFYSTLGKPSS